MRVGRIRPNYGASMSYAGMPDGTNIRDHVDEISLVVRVVEYPADDVVPSEGYFALWSEIGIPADEAAQAVRAVAWDADRQVFHPYVVQQKATDFSWGASGAALTFLVDLGTGLSTEAVAAGIAYSVGKIRGRKRKFERSADRRLRGKRGRGGTSHVLLDVEETTLLAREALVRIFEISDDDLQVESLEHAAETTVLMFMSGAGGRFQATVATLDSGDPYVHVKKIA